MESDFMKTLDFDENDSDSDKYDNDNHESLHEQSETAAEGAKFVKQKFKRTADHGTVPANPLDADLLPLPDEQPEDNDEAEAELPRAVAPAIVKQRNKERLAVALASFGKLPNLPRIPSNDNFKPVVSWPLMDQLTRPTFEPDRERRTKLIATARYIRSLIDMARADSLGDEKDCGIQRTESGKVFFEYGQTFDRKKRTYDKGKNGETDAERYDGVARTARKSLPETTASTVTTPFWSDCPARASRNRCRCWPAVAVAGIRHKRKRHYDRCRQIAWCEACSISRRWYGPHSARNDSGDGSP
jgi:hypothetical protein